VCGLWVRLEFVVWLRGCMWCLGYIRVWVWVLSLNNLRSGLGFGFGVWAVDLAQGLVQGLFRV
jgi:hypothetical protein